MARMGSYLERDIAILFKRIGFNVSINSKEFGFEADVVGKKGNFKILVQTKQYDHSYINVRDLLHQWASKGRHIGIDRTLVVIAGFSISDKDFHLANELGIYLWDDNILHKLKEIETNKELYEKIGSLLKFKDVMKKQEIEKQKEEELKKKQEDKNRKNRKIVAIIILIVVGAIIVFSAFEYLTFNKEKFKNNCLNTLQISRPQFSLKDIELINNYNEVLSWVKSNGGSSESLFLKGNDFKNLKYPLILIEGHTISNIQNNLYPEEFCLCKKAEVGRGLGIGCINVN